MVCSLREAGGLLTCRPWPVPAPPPAPVAPAARCPLRGLGEGRCFLGQPLPGQRRVGGGVHTGHPPGPECRARGLGSRRTSTGPLSPPTWWPIQLRAGPRRPPGLSMKFCSSDFLVRKYLKDRGLGAANQEPDPSGLQPPAPYRPHTEWPCVGWPGLEALARPCERQLPGCASHVGGERTGSPWLSRLPLCSRWRWGAVVLATSPFPLKRSLEVKIGGTLGLGVWPERVPCHPGWQRSPLPPASPACSELCVRTLGEARSPPWDWNAGGGSREGGGGDISSETGAVLAAAGHPPPLRRLSYVP